MGELINALGRSCQCSSVAGDGIIVGDIWLDSLCLALQSSLKASLGNQPQSLLRRLRWAHAAIVKLRQHLACTVKAVAVRCSQTGAVFRPADRLTDRRDHPPAGQRRHAKLAKMPALRLAIISGFAARRPWSCAAEARSRRRRASSGCAESRGLLQHFTVVLLDGCHRAGRYRPSGRARQRGDAVINSRRTRRRR